MEHFVKSKDHVPSIQKSNFISCLVEKVEVRRGSYALLRRFRRILSKYTAEYSMAGTFENHL
jgi:hypothetical protein